MNDVIIEEVDLRPIGTRKELGFSPLRITINGKTGPLVFHARDIRDIQSAIRDYGSSAGWAVAPTGGGNR